MSKDLSSRRRLIGGLMVGGLLLGGCSSGHGAGHAAASTKVTKRAVGFTGRTSCSQVLYIGDSTSIGMISPQQVPSAAERLEARFKAVGVDRLTVNVSGGRSAHERLLGRPNTLDVMKAKAAATYRGCYVVATGTNDAANAHVPSSMSMQQRIDLVMRRANGRPVLWPMVGTTDSGGAYRKDYMQQFDTQLRAAAKRYPNLRLYDWPAERDAQHLEGDGIHDTRLGSRERALMYARALAVAFPQGREKNSSLVVGSVWGRPPGPGNRPRLPHRDGDTGSYWASDTKALTLYTSGPSFG